MVEVLLELATGEGHALLPRRWPKRQQATHDAQARWGGDACRGELVKALILAYLAYWIDELETAKNKMRKIVRTESPPISSQNLLNSAGLISNSEPN